jgi:hypothetical protein
MLLIGDEMLQEQWRYKSLFKMRFTQEVLSAGCCELDEFIICGVLWTLELKERNKENCFIGFYRIFMNDKLIILWMMKEKGKPKQSGEKLDESAKVLK